jgi:hypothetical protein
MRIFWMLVMGFLHLYRAIFTIIPVPLARALFELGYVLMFWAGKIVAFVIGIVGHFSSLVIHFALSRKREFMADAGAAEMTGKPEALISALRRISGNSALETEIEGVRAMLIDSPAIFGIGGLFATHPPVEQRIEALARSARESRGGTPEPVRRGPVSAPRASSQRPTAPPPNMVAAYYGVLRRALGEAVANSTAEQRQAVYRRAQLALFNKMQSDSPLSKDDADDARRGLEAAIERIEIEVRTATRSAAQRDKHLRPERR